MKVNCSKIQDSLSHFTIIIHCIRMFVLTYRIMVIFIGAVLLLLNCVEHSHSQTLAPLTCVDVDFPDCKIFENKTPASAKTSSTIIIDVVTLRTLYTQVNCSDFSHFFICAASYPYCIEATETVRYPCREMCQRVKRECNEVISLLDKVGIFKCETYSIGGHCITQDEALVSIRRAGLLPKAPVDDISST